MIATGLDTNMAERSLTERMDKEPSPAGRLLQVVREVRSLYWHAAQLASLRVSMIENMQSKNRSP
jgi:hypothetical protein